MNIKKNFLILLALFNSLFVIGQDTSNSINSSDNSIKIWRSSTDTNAVIAIPVNSFSISQNTEKFIHIMVNYSSQPDIAISVDAADKNSDGNFENIIRPLNPYTNFGNWETLIFPVSGGENGIDVNTLLIYPDLGLENLPVGQILNTSSIFGSFCYIDEIILKETNTLSTKNILVDNLSIYPNPSSKTFTISTLKNIKNIALYNNLGKEFTKNIHKLNNNTYDISTLSKGLYFVKILDDNGNVELRKLIKK